MRRTRCRLPNRAAFTLVELLVAAGIILALVGLVLPLFSRIRQESLRVVCLGNLRQLVSAANEYVARNDGWYPEAYYSASDGTNAYSVCWDLTTITNSSTLVSRVVPGLLWGGRTDERIQQCPSYDGPADWNIDPYTGYNYNTSYIGHGQLESIPAPIQARQVHNGARVAIFGDGQYSAGADKFMRAPYPNPGDRSFDGRYAGTQGFRHLGLTNVAFCDGHAESLSNRFTDNADGAANVAPGTGFLSSDNSLYDPQ